MTEYQGYKFKLFLQDRRISVISASEILGVQRQSIYDYFKTSNLSPTTVRNITDKFKVSESDIWGESVKLEAVPISLHPHIEDDPTGVSKFIYAADGTLGMKVKIVPIKAQAGYLVGYGDPEYYDDFEIIPVEKEHRGFYLGFEVKGHSMTTLEPEYFRHSIFEGVKVVGRELPRHQWKYKLHTHNYDSWVIVHKTDGILIKQIIKHDVENGVITIHSLNPDKKEFPDKHLHLDDIEQIFNVVKKIDE